MFHLFVFFVIFNASLAKEQLSGKLVFSHILFRHGDRTPVDPYPNDPWRNIQYWPTGWGQLTNTGKMQHYHLGKWLRQRYSSILNETYSKDQIYVRSTDVDRTLMSALSNLAGLYQPINKDIWNNEISWQPIPVHTVPEKEDSVLSSKKPCPAYSYLIDKLKGSDEFRKMYKRFKYLFDYLTEYTGKEINSFEGVEKIYNTLFIEKLYNKTLPDWTKKVYPDGDMKFIADLSFAIPTYTRELARFKKGPLLKEMLMRFKHKAKSKSKLQNRSVWIYSGHDTTVANLLNTLNLFQWHNPPYTACVLLELRIYNSKPLISIFYKNTSAEPEPMYIPDCGIQCPLDKMFTLYSDVIPNNWESECQQIPSRLLLGYKGTAVNSTLGFAITIAAGVIVLMALVYIISIYYRRRNYFSYRSYVQ